MIERHAVSIQKPRRSRKPILNAAVRRNVRHLGSALWVNQHHRREARLGLKRGAELRSKTDGAFVAGIVVDLFQLRQFSGWPRIALAGFLKRYGQSDWMKRQWLYVQMSGQRTQS